MPENVTLKGKSLALKGNLLKEGQPCPECELVSNDLKPVKLSSFKGKALLILSVPSLDTETCNVETRRFNKEMDQYQNLLSAVCVSMDLPFAQSRWCGAAGVKNVTTLSDYKNREFGEKFGVLIPELGLLARAVFLVDAQGKLQSVYLVKEVTEEPDYNRVREQINHLLQGSNKK